VSGPDISRPKPGSNGIGLFQIGISPIGTIPSFDIWSTVISQYANSLILAQLLQDFEAWIDPTQNLDSFFDLIWDVDTAQGYGLDVWGRIVGVNRTLSVQFGARYLGFHEQGITVDPFNVSPWYAGVTSTSNFNLLDKDFRRLILTKAFVNICNGSIQSINQALLSLFPGRGNCHVTDDGGMHMTYVFPFVLAPVEQAIVQNSGVLPTPTGVQIAFSIL
jgi:Protein of unknown function (DUF2612)